MALPVKGEPHGNRKHDVMFVSTYFYLLLIRLLCMNCYCFWKYFFISLCIGSEQHHSCFPRSSWGCTNNSGASGLCLLKGILNQKLTMLQQRDFLVVPELPMVALHSLFRNLLYCRLCCSWPGHSLPRGKSKQDAISLSSTISS